MSFTLVTDYITVCERFEVLSGDRLHNGFELVLRFPLVTAYIMVCESLEIPLTTAKMSSTRRLFSERERSMPSVP